MTAVIARRFNINDSHSRPVRIEAGKGGLWLHGDADAEPIELNDVGLSERVQGTPRLLHLPDGGVCEIDDLAALDNLLDEAKYNAGWKQRISRDWQIAILVLLVLGCLATVAYRLSLPFFNSGMAERVPNQWVHVASEQTLATLDRNWLMPSRLSNERQAELRNWFAALHAPTEGAPPYRLLFRRSGPINARSFSLPDGDIVITDEMVELTHDDRKLLALMAYELGHLHYKHSLQSAVGSTSVAAALAGRFDYVQNSAAGAAKLSENLMQLHYSFENEHQADEYAISMLRANDLQPSIMVDVLTLLAQNANPASRNVPGLLAPSDFLSRRIAALREDS